MGGQCVEIVLPVSAGLASRLPWLWNSAFGCLVRIVGLWC